MGLRLQWGPKVDAEAFAVAEKLVQVEMTPKDRAEAAGNWQQSMAAVVERRVGAAEAGAGGGGCAGDGVVSSRATHRRLDGL